ncbi:MAG: glycerophosphodiester phosphodiesterase [Acidimicrobiales bacterium]
MVRVIAHRGASATHHENTLAAFRAAAEQGATGIELDVRLSADEVLMVHHDAHLADGRLIRELTAEAMPDHVPTLGEALDVAGDMWVNVEIKNVPEEPDFDADHRISVAVAGLVAASLAQSAEVEGGAAAESDGDSEGTAGSPPSGRSASDRFMVSSFNVDSVERIRHLDPSIPLALLVWGQADPASLIARAVAHSFEAIHPHDLLVDRAFVTRARAEGLQVNVWTVDDPDRVRQLAGFGVDGIITNDPRSAVDALAG